MSSQTTFTRWRAAVLAVAILALGGASTLHAQGDRVRVVLPDGRVITINRATLSFAPSAAVEAVNRITRATGLRPNFKVSPVTDGSVENAAAVRDESGRERYILYNPSFLDALIRTTRTDWSAVAILAHEIGHHLAGHTLRPGEGNPDWELEADEWAGFALARMNATREQAIAAMLSVPEFDTSTHPGRARRTNALLTGWGSGAGNPSPGALAVAPAPTTANNSIFSPRLIERAQTFSISSAYPYTVRAQSWNQGKNLTGMWYGNGMWVVIFSSSTARYEFNLLAPYDSLMRAMQRKWSEGLQVVRLTPTGANWAVAMARGTGITHQVFRYDTVFPQQFVQQYMNAGYRITQADFADNRWIVVMSQGTGWTSQRYQFGTWGALEPFMDAGKAEGYVLTEAATNGSGWLVVMTRGTRYTSTYWIAPRTVDDLNQMLDSQWNAGGRIIDVVPFRSGWFVLTAKNTGYR